VASDDSELKFIHIILQAATNKSREWGPIKGIMEAPLRKASYQHILGDIVPALFWTHNMSFPYIRKRHVMFFLYKKNMLCLL